MTLLPPDPGGLRPRSAWRATDAVAVALLALVVRIPAFSSGSALTFDDGVFGNSVVAMRAGGVPFRDVFSSQGPLFLPLAFLGDLLGGQTMNGPRVIAVISGVAAVVITYTAALRLTDRTGALLAAGLLATSGGLAWVTAPLAADGPALAFAAAAMWAALVLRDRPTTAVAVALGAAVGATLSTKSLEAPVLVPVGLVLAAPLLGAARRRELDTAALARALVAVAASVVVFLAVTLPLGFADVWDQSVRYRTDAASERDIPATAGKLLSTLWDRDLALLFLLAVTVIAAVVAHRRSGSGRHVWVETDRGWATREVHDGPYPVTVPSGRLLTVSWLVTTLVWLSVVVSPLWRPHVAAVSIPLVLVVATYRPPLRVIAVTGVLAVPMVAVQLDGLVPPEPYRGTEAELVEQLSSLPDGAWVLSDEPGVVWRSGLRTTDDLVDPSMLRREQGRYTEDSLVADASDPRICAFVAISEQRFAHFAELPRRLEQIGYEPVAGVGDGDVLYLRDSCEAGTVPAG